MCKYIFDLLQVNKITTKFLSKQSFKKQPSIYCENIENIIESKMAYSESDSSFASNLVSDFDTDSKSNSSSASIICLSLFFSFCICTLPNKLLDNYSFSFS